MSSGRIVAKLRSCGELVAAVWLELAMPYAAVLGLSQRVCLESVSLGDCLPSNRASQRMSLKSDLWLQFLRVNIGKGGVAKQ